MCSPVWFEWIRWIGVAYLLFLGVRQWRAPPVDLTRNGTGATVGARAWRCEASFVGLTNPKTLLFYGAFFPQFLDPAKSRLSPQVGLL